MQSSDCSHPSLVKDPNDDCGGWKWTIINKCGYTRTQLRRAGNKELCLNGTTGRKRSNDDTLDKNKRGSFRVDINTGPTL